MGRLMVLWAVGVGSVIGGDFFGWSYLLSSGIGSSMLSLLFTMCMYYCMSTCVSSLSAIVTKPGGADVFVAEGLGADFGLATAALETAKILLCTCAINNGAVSYFQATVDLGNGVGIYLAYIGLFLIFCYLNLLGAKYSGNFQICVTVFSLTVLLFYWGSVCDTVNFNEYALGNSSGWFVDGISGFLLSQPFASWLFLGFEELPLVAKSMNDPDDMEIATMVQLSEVNGDIFEIPNDNSSFVLPRESGPAGTAGASSPGIPSSLSKLTVTTINSPSKPSSSADRITTVAMLLSFATIAAAGILTMFLGAASAPGAYTLSSAASPLVDGVKGVYGNGSWVVSALNVLVIVALVTPFNAFLLFSAHHLSLLSLNGLLPVWFHQDQFLRHCRQLALNSVQFFRRASNEVSLTANEKTVLPANTTRTAADEEASLDKSTSAMMVSNPIQNCESSDSLASFSPPLGESSRISRKHSTASSSHRHPDTPKNAIIFVGVSGSLILAILTLIFGSGMVDPSAKLQSDVNVLGFCLFCS